MADEAAALRFLARRQDFTCYLAEADAITITLAPAGHDHGVAILEETALCPILCYYHH